MKKIILSLILTLTIISCSKKESVPMAKFFEKGQITALQIDSLKELGFNVDTSIVALYQFDKISKESAFITPLLFGSYKDEKIVGTELSNIYDIYHSHAVDTASQSSITIYLKDNAEYKIDFLGGTDLDEQFFKSLRETWRKSIAKTQEKR